ncbi:N-acetyl-1-D-myo-inositol-2-amino-2-deoxy-alpha-D-glucopyranoside deacetylase [Streptomyces aidingensis]|uniref:1D-myo-inositol 2-acetamido-2-deoxy-alpha-D-glucopyranoside deacetylase n=1 Tax=Streptomyces aidingensis TaxID=910347 RepID=A0A1I1EZS2_9ACTN|nr:N-acetyl-1-D-myo-inositol-2-amino-2-deoxy-alpha-D-glucopyranoside deacetylase [Streptomyces aidingensis]SFB90430.1 N-acetyl-1-D-myo-inositol-2-amino-2-deoxy-alpha-D-glucopyranoside deacetylase [Streptomyces aidingensis]
MSSRACGLLLVHAHPDDESITNGVTMAACAARGVPVTLVTCTRGEEGEIIPAGLAHLAADRDDALGPHRERELAAAMAELGVTDHRFLGGPGRWRDSGMMGVTANRRPGAFWQADPGTAAGQLAEVILEVRPRVLITYDPAGGYGHPDHIQAHRVAMRGAELAAGRGHRIERVLWNCVPRTAAEAALARLRAGGPGPFRGVASLTDIPGVADDELVVLAVTGDAAARKAKAAAMRAHATQIELAEPGEPGAEPLFALSNGLAQPVWSTEYYRLAWGTPVPEGADDPFDGLETEAGEGDAR